MTDKTRRATSGNLYKERLQKIQNDSAYQAYFGEDGSEDDDDYEVSSAELAEQDEFDSDFEDFDDPQQAQAAQIGSEDANDPDGNGEKKNLDKVKKSIRKFPKNSQNSSKKKESIKKDSDQPSSITEKESSVQNTSIQDATNIQPISTTIESESTNPPILGTIEHPNTPLTATNTFVRQSTRIRIAPAQPVEIPMEEDEDDDEDEDEDYDGGDDDDEEDDDDNEKEDEKQTKLEQKQVEPMVQEEREDEAEDDNDVGGSSYEPSQEVIQPTLTQEELEDRRMKTFIRNLQNFPYVRGIHFETDILPIQRIDRSYIVSPDLIRSRETFAASHPDINRDYIGLPYKSIDDQPCRSKTDYHRFLFKQEDERYKQDSEIMILKQAIGALSEILVIESEQKKQELKDKVNQLKLFNSYNTYTTHVSSYESEFSPSKETEKDLIEELSNKLTQRMIALNICRDQFFEKWRKFDALHFPASNDQITFNLKEDERNSFAFDSLQSVFLKKKMAVIEWLTDPQTYTLEQLIQFSQSIDSFEQSEQNVTEKEENGVEQIGICQEILTAFKATPYRKFIPPSFIMNLSNKPILEQTINLIYTYLKDQQERGNSLVYEEQIRAVTTMCTRLFDLHPMYINDIVNSCQKRSILNYLRSQRQLQATEKIDTLIKQVTDYSRDTPTVPFKKYKKQRFFPVGERSKSLEGGKHFHEIIQLFYAIYQRLLYLTIVLDKSKVKTFIVPEEFLSEDYEQENQINDDGSIPVYDLFFGVVLSFIKTDIDDMSYESILKSLGNRASIPLLNMKYMLSLLQKALSQLIKDPIESRQFKRSYASSKNIEISSSESLPSDDLLISCNVSFEISSSLLFIHSRVPLNLLREEPQHDKEESVAKIVEEKLPEKNQDNEIQSEINLTSSIGEDKQPDTQIQEEIQPTQQQEELKENEQEPQQEAQVMEEEVLPQQNPQVINQLPKQKQLTSTQPIAEEVVIHPAQSINQTQVSSPPIQIELKKQNITQDQHKAASIVPQVQQTPLEKNSDMQQQVKGTLDHEGQQQTVQGTISVDNAKQYQEAQDNLIQLQNQRVILQQLLSSSPHELLGKLQLNEALKSFDSQIDQVKSKIQTLIQAAAAAPQVQPQKEATAPSVKKHQVNSQPKPEKSNKDTAIIPQQQPIQLQQPTPQQSKQNYQQQKPDNHLTFEKQRVEEKQFHANEEKEDDIFGGMTIDPPNFDNFAFQIQENPVTPNNPTKDRVRIAEIPNANDKINQRRTDTSKPTGINLIVPPQSVQTNDQPHKNVPKLNKTTQGIANQSSQQQIQEQLQQGFENPLVLRGLNQVQNESKLDNHLAMQPLSPNFGISSNDAAGKATITEPTSMKLLLPQGNDQQLSTLIQQISFLQHNIEEVQMKILTLRQHIATIPQSQHNSRETQQELQNLNSYYAQEEVLQINLINLKSHQEALSRQMKQNEILSQMQADKNNSNISQLTNPVNFQASIESASRNHQTLFRQSANKIGLASSVDNHSLQQLKNPDQASNKNMTLQQMLLFQQHQQQQQQNLEQQQQFHSTELAKSQQIHNISQQLTQSNPMGSDIYRFQMNNNGLLFDNSNHAGETATLGHSQIWGAGALPDQRLNNLNGLQPGVDTQLSAMKLQEQLLQRQQQSAVGLSTSIQIDKNSQISPMLLLQSNTIPSLGESSHNLALSRGPTSKLNITQGGNTLLGTSSASSLQQEQAMQQLQIQNLLNQKRIQEQQLQQLQQHQQQQTQPNQMSLSNSLQLQIQQLQHQNQQSQMIMRQNQGQRQIMTEQELLQKLGSQKLVDATAEDLKLLVQIRESQQAALNSNLANKMAQSKTDFPVQSMQQFHNMQQQQQSHQQQPQTQSNQQQQQQQQQLISSQQIQQQQHQIQANQMRLNSDFLPSHNPNDLNSLTPAQKMFMQQSQASLLNQQLVGNQQAQQAQLMHQMQLAQQAQSVQQAQQQMLVQQNLRQFQDTQNMQNQSALLNLQQNPQRLQEYFKQQTVQQQSSTQLPSNQLQQQQQMLLLQQQQQQQQQQHQQQLQQQMQQKLNMQQAQQMRQIGLQNYGLTNSQQLNLMNQYASAQQGYPTQDQGSQMQLEMMAAKVANQSQQQFFDQSHDALAKFRKN